jgi:hypothetical protein
LSDTLAEELLQISITQLPNFSITQFPNQESKARSWWAGEFFPQSADDFLKVAWAMGTQENSWLRQVGGYWGMVASFVNNGALNEQLFLAPGFSGEMFLIYAKIHPFVKELRQKLNDPNAFKDVETAVTRTKWGRDRLQFMIKRVEIMRQKRAEQKASSAQARS